MTQKVKEIKGKQCSECGSTQTYLRLKEGTRFCRNCGHTEKIKIEVKK